MQSRILYTEGKGHFTEGTIEISDLAPNEIRVASKKTGVCRSDIDMMNGKFFVEARGFELPTYVRT